LEGPYRNASATDEGSRLLANAHFSLDRARAAMSRVSAFGSDWRGDNLEIFATATNLALEANEKLTQAAGCLGCATTEAPIPPAARTRLASYGQKSSGELRDWLASRIFRRRALRTMRVIEKLLDRTAPGGAAVLQALPDPQC
jgi:hypothetical protein